MNYLISRESEAYWTRSDNSFYQTLKQEHLIQKEKQKLDNFIESSNNSFKKTADKINITLRTSINKI